MSKQLNLSENEIQVKKEFTCKEDLKAFYVNNECLFTEYTVKNSRPFLNNRPNTYSIVYWIAETNMDRVIQAGEVETLILESEAA